MSIPTLVAAIVASLSFGTPAERNALPLDQVQCLATNIYHEARGETLSGMIAVGLVTANRVNSHRWPDTYCEVVYQRKQFSWTLKRPRITDRKALKVATEIAARIIAGDFHYPAFDADHYVNLNKANPRWRYAMEFKGRIGDHWFYKTTPNRSRLQMASR